MGGPIAFFRMALNSMRTISRVHLYAWLPVVLLCLAIFIQSCFASPDIGPSFPLKDKLLHLSAYAFLAYLVFRACRMTRPAWRSPLMILVASVLFATLFGASDELHQAFVAARQADGFDLLADFAGGIIGGLVGLMVYFKAAIWRK